MKLLFSGSLLPFHSGEASFLVRHLPEDSRLCKNVNLHTVRVLHLVSFIVPIYCSEHKNLLPGEDRRRIQTSAPAPAPLNSPRTSRLFHSWLADEER